MVLPSVLQRLRALAHDETPVVAVRSVVRRARHEVAGLALRVVADLPAVVHRPLAIRAEEVAAIKGGASPFCLSSQHLHAVLSHGNHHAAHRKHLIADSAAIRPVGSHGKYRVARLADGEVARGVGLLAHL